jgi:hypothetical protein
MGLKTVRLPDHIVTKLLSGPRLVGGGHALAPQVPSGSRLVGAGFDYEMGELVLRFIGPDPVAEDGDPAPSNSSC